MIRHRVQVLVNCDEKKCKAEASASGPLFFGVEQKLRDSGWLLSAGSSVQLLGSARCPDHNPEWQVKKKEPSAQLSLPLKAEWMK